MQPSTVMAASLADAPLAATSILSNSYALPLSGSLADDRSGVLTNSVAVSLSDWRGAAVEGTRYATADSSTWALDYPFSVAFAIDAGGQLSLTQTLDYETTAQYWLTVAASDGHP